MAQSMPVFKPMKARRMVFNLGGAEWAKVACVAAAGALLACLLGGCTHIVEVPATGAIRQKIYEEYAQVLEDVRAVDALMKQRGESDAAKLDLSPGQRGSLEKARGAGIDADTAKAELWEHLPATAAQTEPVIPDIPRWALLFGLPTIITMIANMELWHGTTMLREAKRLTSFARRPRDFYSAPKDYLDRKA